MEQLSTMYMYVFMMLYVVYCVLWFPLNKYSCVFYWNLSLILVSTFWLYLFCCIDIVNTWWDEFFLSADKKMKNKIIKILGNNHNHTSNYNAALKFFDHSNKKLKHSNGRRENYQIISRHSRCWRYLVFLPGQIFSLKHWSLKQLCFCQNFDITQL